MGILQKIKEALRISATPEENEKLSQLDLELPRGRDGSTEIEVIERLQADASKSGFYNKVGSHAEEIAASRESDGPDKGEGPTR